MVRSLSQRVVVKLRKSDPQWWEVHRNRMGLGLLPAYVQLRDRSCGEGQASVLKQKIGTHDFAVNLSNTSIVDRTTKQI
jgi:hypothetical protein